MLFADVAAEDAGESSGPARMRRTDAAVAGYHDPWLLIERFDVAFDHGVADDFGFGVGGVAFADDSNEHIRWREFVGFCDFGERMTGVGIIRLELGDGEMIRAA